MNSDGRLHLQVLRRRVSPTFNRPLASPPLCLHFPLCTYHLPTSVIKQTPTIRASHISAYARIAMSSLLSCTGRPQLAAVLELRPPARKAPANRQPSTSSCCPRRILQPQHDHHKGSSWTLPLLEMIDLRRNTCCQKSAIFGFDVGVVGRRKTQTSLPATQFSLRTQLYWYDDFSSVSTGPLGQSQRWSSRHKLHSIRQSLSRNFQWR